MSMGRLLRGVGPIDDSLTSLSKSTVRSRTASRRHGAADRKDRAKFDFAKIALRPAVSCGENTKKKICKGLGAVSQSNQPRRPPISFPVSVLERCLLCATWDI